MFLDGLNYFGNKTKVQGPIFGGHFESFKEVFKNIGIHPRALISHFKPIINHGSFKQSIQNSRTLKQTLKMFAVFAISEKRSLWGTRKKTRAERCSRSVWSIPENLENRYFEKIS